MKTFFFDLDGTLCDSRPGLIHAFQAAFRALGIAREYDLQIDRFLGTPLPEAFRAITSSISEAGIKKGIHAFRAAYEEKGVLQTPLYNGARDLLETLHKDRAKVWLVTSKPTHYAHRILENLEISALFGGVVGAGMDENDTKTSLIATALKNSGSAAPDCIMLGDRFYDVVGALENSVVPVGALWGYGTREEMFGAGCRSFAEDLRQFKASYVDQASMFSSEPWPGGNRHLLAARQRRSS